MALLRTELKGAGSIVHQRREDGSLGTKFVGVYEGIIETTEDLGLPRLADKGLYIKNSSNEWEAIAA